MKHLLILLTLSCWVCAVVGSYEVAVTFSSYANPSGRCVDCNGATPGNPACCDTSFTVPQGQSCPTTESCDTALEYCYRALGTTGRCPQSARSIASRLLSGSRNFTITNSFFGLPNPVVTTRSEPWQGLQVYLTLHECFIDRTVCRLGFGIIDSIPINIGIVVGTSIQATYNGIANISHMTASIEVKCADSFYGSDCSMRCLNFRNCRLCGLRGFTGQFCQFRNRDCRVQYCNGRGRCVPGSPLCTCDAGFTGERCETNIDDCAGRNCNNNGVCVDLIRNFRCECNLGFTGSSCETNVNDCDQVNCNNGTCRVGINDFKCVCDTGFTGDHCQTNINDCEDANCNNGTCVDKINNFSCECYTGFTGDLCETNIDDCKVVDCNNGTCVDEIDSFTCQCDTGFTGDHCETNIDDCEDVNCNSGVCVDEVANFSCECNPGFTGDLCETNIDDCDGISCNDGTCIDEIEDFSCDCNSGFTGEFCQTISVAAASRNVASIAGGTVGAAIGVILLILITVIVVVMVIKTKGTEEHSHKGPADETVIGDNPSYDTKFAVLTNSLDSAHYQDIPTSRNNQNSQNQNAQEFSIASLQERDFDNPIYGSAEHEREVDNPIYGADDSASQEMMSESLYTVPNSPPCNVYDRMADDHSPTVSNVNINSDHVYSTVAT